MVRFWTSSSACFTLGSSLRRSARSPLIEALYNGTTEADITTEVIFEDGRKGAISARVKIADCEIVPVSTKEKAA